MFWDASYYGSHGGTAVDGPRDALAVRRGLARASSTRTCCSPTPARRASDGDADVPARRLDAVHAHGHRAADVARHGRGQRHPRAGRPLVLDRRRRHDADHRRARDVLRDRAALRRRSRVRRRAAAGDAAWFLAEGATGPFFETFVLVGNPNPAAANVTFTFLTDGGQTVVRNKTVPANGRLTINIETRGSARWPTPPCRRRSSPTSRWSPSARCTGRARRPRGPKRTTASASRSLGDEMGPGRGPRRHGTTASRPTSCSPTRTDGAANVRDHVPARERLDGREDVHGERRRSRFNVAVSSAAPELQNEEFGALIEVTNGLADRRRARDVLERARPDVGRRHERPGDAAALTAARGG